MAQDNKTCQVCGELGHSKFYCKSRKRKRIPVKGKKAEEWNAVRNSWITRFGFYHKCYICGVPLNELTLTLDHKIPRSNAKNYANRHDDENLKPACWTCNGEKGSKHI